MVTPVSIIHTVNYYSLLLLKTGSMFQCETQWQMVGAYKFIKATQQAVLSNIYSEGKSTEQLRK